MKDRAWSHVTSSGTNYGVSQDLRHLEWNGIIGRLKRGGTGRDILPRSNVLTGMFCFDCYTTGYLYLPPGI